MAKNRHNGVHTDNPSGKTDYVIAGLLPTGKENAISTKELVQLSGCSSARELQIYIAEERKAGAVICSSTAGGYFLPASHKETAEFCKALENRAKNTFVALQSAKKALNQLPGQEKLLEEVQEDE